MDENKISDIVPLVDNMGIGDGDVVDLRYNQLLIQPGSPAWLDIEALQGRGANVDFDPQNLVRPVGFVVTFPDPGLEDAIRDAIRKHTGDIYSTDLEGLSVLAATDRGITSLEGIQHCTDLMLLALDKNQVVDISPLSGLTNLMTLFLWDNEIADMSPLVSNEGISTGDFVDIRYNQLFIQPGSPDLLDVEALQSRGVSVDFYPQR